MKVDGTPLYATADMGAQVTQYSAQHSTPLPKHIIDYHAANQDHADAMMLTSNFQSQLHLLLARSIGAKRVLEIGVFLGYSAMVWSHAVGPDGSVTGLEYSPDFARVAREGLAKNGIDNVELIVGPAAETLPNLSPSQPYDLVFIDADKQGYAGYLDQLLAASQPGAAQRLLRPGALILADNVLRRGYVADPDSAPPGWRDEEHARQLEAVRTFNDQCVAEPRLEAFLLPLWDGLSVLRVVD
jgi:predicted O-methyltransferase YrrM